LSERPAFSKSFLSRCIAVSILESAICASFLLVSLTYVRDWSLDTCVLATREKAPALRRPADVSDDFEARRDACFSTEGEILAILAFVMARQLGVKTEEEEVVRMTMKEIDKLHCERWVFFP
jgi:hypothetical protein